LRNSSSGATGGATPAYAAARLATTEAPIALSFWPAITGQKLSANWIVVHLSA
jgi:hypothetical protein